MLLNLYKYCFTQNSIYFFIRLQTTTNGFK